MKAVEFANLNDDERELVNQIAKRAQRHFEKRGKGVRVQTIEMDLAATHAHTPLDFAKLSAADDFNFCHDVFGIWRNMNRETGRLENHFMPRCARPATATA